MPSKDYAATRYSGLAQITPATVKSLHPVWTFSTGTLGGHEGQPLVVNNTMYVVTPYPNVLYAFDLTKEGYPLKWKYRPPVDPNSIGIACCDVVNRGAVYADGKIIYNLLDGHTVAVDAATRQGIVVDEDRGSRLGRDDTDGAARREESRARRRVRRRVRHPRLGEGARSRDGQDRVDRDNIGPDSLVLAKPGTFKPFYDKGAQLGQSTWPGGCVEARRRPGVGMDVVRSRARPRLLRQSAIPAPYNAEQRLGDNKWTASVLARRPGQTASLVWAYQFTPHDSWDYDAVAMILVDLTIDGKMRKALVHFDKNGFAYTIDRATGEVLVAEPYVT